MAEKKSNGGLFKKFIIALVLIILIALGITCFNYYMKYYGPNVTDKQEYLYIHTGATYADVYKSIREESIVKDSTSFDWAAQNMKYTHRVKAGRYHLHSGMSNRKLINELASGTQTPVTLAFHTMRLKTDFAGFVGKKIEPDSASIINILDSVDFVKKYGFVI